jgi:hypothetical protein
MRGYIDGNQTTALPAAFGPDILSSVRTISLTEFHKHTARYVHSVATEGEFVVTIRGVPTALCEWVDSNRPKKGPGSKGGKGKK